MAFWVTKIELCVCTTIPTANSEARNILAAIKHLDVSFSPSIWTFIFSSHLFNTKQIDCLWEYFNWSSTSKYPRWSAKFSQLLYRTSMKTANETLSRHQLALLRVKRLILIYTLFFVTWEQFYKNNETQICPKIKNKQGTIEAWLQTQM